MTPFKKPDLNAPRYREESKEVSIVELLEKIKKENPQYADLDKKTVDKVLATHHGNIWEHAMLNRDGVDLPNHMGHMMVAGSKLFRENVNVPESIKQGVRILHKNWETDGHVAKIYYTNRESRYFLKHKFLWAFEPVRTFQRAVSKTYPTIWRELMILSSRNVTKVYRDTLIKKRLKNKHAKIKDVHYNEFDID